MSYRDIFLVENLTAQILCSACSINTLLYFFIIMLGIVIRKNSRLNLEKELV